MVDQATTPASVASPTAAVGGPGPALEQEREGAGAQVISLDSWRQRPSPEALVRSRACHPAGLPTRRLPSPA